MGTDGELYAQHGDSLIRFAASLVGRSEAADVVHDAVAGMLSSGALARADNPRALLYTAVLARARSTHRSTFRRRRREERFAESLVQSNPEVMPEVADAVARLSPQQRACVFLAYWEDLAPEQIGARLGIAEGTVKRHLWRARQHLREALDDDR